MITSELCGLWIRGNSFATSATTLGLSDIEYKTPPVPNLASDAQAANASRAMGIRGIND